MTELLDCNIGGSISTKWKWPVAFVVGDTDVVIDGAQAALSYLVDDWPFKKSAMQRLAIDQISRSIADRSFDETAYVLFRAAIVAGGVKPKP